MPHLEPVSGLPHGDAPTSGAAVTAPTSGAAAVAPTSGAAVTAADPPSAAASEPAAASNEGGPAAFAGAGPPTVGPVAPTAGAPFPNQPYAWSYPPLNRRLNNMALASMIVSLASFLTCPLLGLLGVYLGTRARNEIKTRGDDGDGMALAGIVAGWVAAGLSVLLVAFYAIFIGAVIGAAVINNR